ncbi:MAG TPA: ATP-dependent helicase HrpB, partial [Longimicrobiales bacterium]|nr:ATP-dependent helicase HrpB [Longimicrobiales bacterium]
MTLPDLPVTAVLEEVEGALDRRGGAVLVAPPGAGKTTIVPLALLDAPWLEDGRIVVLEPRRLAARAAADRMSRLLGEEGAGGTVGYRVRMDTRVSARTRIEVVTEGVLTRMIQSDPGLEETGLVVFDEFHERSLPADLGLALTLQARRLLRPDLRILVMSATLDPEPVADLLDGAPVIRAEGERHPVETRYRSRPVEGWIEPPVARTVLGALERDEGDVLAFLPGAGEIRRTAERLEDAGLPSRVELHPLFGNLPRRDQDRAIAPSPPGRRKIVLATAIAETSLTIEGVRVVVDSGLMRVPRFDPGTGMTRLETIRVSRDSADQRRGRAGRTAPGVCYRLWTEAEDRGLVPRRRPEIVEADLASLALDLAVWGARPGELRWLDPPPRPSFEQAEELLRELEAVDDEGSATDHGRTIAGLGLHPRLAHMLVRAKERGLGAVACDLAALLGDRDVFRGEGRAPDADLRLRLEAMRRARDAGAPPGGVRGERVDRGRLRRALREARHWRRKIGLPEGGEVGTEAVEEAGVLAALAYPDRVGRLRDDGKEGRYLLRSGRGARFREAQALSRSEWIVAAEVEGSGADARIFRAAPVTETEVEELFSDQIVEVEEVVWDGGAGRVRARRRRMLGALVLTESPLESPDPAALSGALLEGIREEGLGVLPWGKETRQLRQRLHFLHRIDPERWPDTSEETLAETLEAWLLPYLAGMRSLDDLSTLDLR